MALAAVASARTAALQLGLPKRPRVGRRAAASGEAAELKGLNREFLSIALPAVVQFAAEPVARLVDTAYMGRLGATALGGAGAAVSAQYALGKLSNDPLLRTSISLVAAEGDANDSSIAAALWTANPGNGGGTIDATGGSSAVSAATSSWVGGSLDRL